MHLSPSYQNTDDITLWNMLLEGNTAILETLYKRHYDLLLNYGLKVCSDNELVKDCIQNLFVKLHSVKRLKATTSVQAYLLRSLRNALFDTLSSGKETVSLDDFSINIPIDDTDYERFLSKDDHDLILTKRLVQAYSNLSSNQKNAIYLRYIKGFSYKEISAFMEINNQSSMNLVSRAIAKLRVLIESTPFLIFIL